MVKIVWVVEEEVNVLFQGITLFCLELVEDSWTVFCKVEVTDFDAAGLLRLWEECMSLCRLFSDHLFYRLFDRWPISRGQVCLWDLDLCLYLGHESVVGMAHPQSVLQAYSSPLHQNTRRWDGHLDLAGVVDLATGDHDADY